MNIRSIWLIILLCLACALMLSSTEVDFSLEFEDMDELLSAEEYPPDMDTLEEFIQSYYLLLDSNEYLDRYKFINAGRNSFGGDKLALKIFYEKLLELRSGLRNRVSIYQLGDSHIQSGYFPGTARASLQKYYGDAGRGLVFPLRLAGTNQPDDYRISSTGGFSRLNNERGLCGYALNTSKGATLAIKTNPFFVSDNSFNKLSLLSSAPGVKPLFKVKDEQLQPKEISLGEYQYSEASWDTTVTSMELSLQGDSSHLYGLMLEKQQPGLLFHATGINGAGFYNLIGASQLFSQINLLNPDLIVISLGTNDAQGNFKEKVFSANLEKFMAEFRGANPTTPVLFTLPPDSHKRGKHNQDLGKVEKIIIDYAKNNNCAWWDLSAVMGGKGSVIKWRKEQMASKDLLHYTPKGYMLQGYLFYQALIKSYKAFSEK